MLCLVSLLFFSIPPIVLTNSCIHEMGATVCNSMEDLYNYSNAESQRVVKVDGGTLATDILKIDDLFICDRPNFRNFPSMEVLALNNVQLLHVSSDCLAGMDKIVAIDLSNNYLTSINMRSFRTSDAMKVRHIDLNRNHIGVMEFTDVELPSLLKLDANSNRLKYFEVHTENLPKVLSIDLSTNEILGCNIESETLTILHLARNRIKSFVGFKLNLPNLQNIHLEDNSLLEITSDMAANMPNLNVIYLSHNILSSVSFPRLNRQIMMYFSYNNITSLNDINISNGYKVTRLYLDSNNIFKLDGDKLHLENLLYFSCKTCSIHHIDQLFFGSAFKNLIFLYLQFNYLTSANIFITNEENLKLHFIDMSFNAIRRIGRRDFEQLTEVEKLFLYSNEISTIETGAFDAMTALRDLRLNNNKLFKLPTNLFGKTLLSSLQLSGNNLPYFHIPGWQEATSEMSDSNSSTFRSLGELHMQRNPLQCKCLQVIRSWAKISNITLVINDENVKSGIRPACIANDQGCKADVKKDFVREYWHLFNHETFEHMFDNGDE